MSDTEDEFSNRRDRTPEQPSAAAQAVVRSRQESMSLMVIPVSGPPTAANRQICRPFGVGSRSLASPP